MLIQELLYVIASQTYYLELKAIGSVVHHNIFCHFTFIHICSSIVIAASSIKCILKNKLFSLFINSICSIVVILFSVNNKELIVLYFYTILR